MDSAVPSSAVVMLTGMASEQVAVEGIRTGAQDYLELVHPNSLEIQIIQILARQLMGKLSCHNPATFKISFPEAQIGQHKLQSAVGGG